MDKKVKSRAFTLTAVLLAVNLMISVGIIVFLMIQNIPGRFDGHAFAAETKYTMYIGTNDKDTYTQLIPTEEAEQKVNEICKKHTGGYTVEHARGGWVDEKGNETSENTLVYSFIGISDEQINAIADEVLTALNQNTVLIEKETVHSFSYGHGE